MALTIRQKELELNDLHVPDYAYRKLLNIVRENFKIYRPMQIQIMSSERIQDLRYIAITIRNNRSFRRWQILIQDVSEKRLKEFIKSLNDNFKNVSDNEFAFNIKYEYKKIVKKIKRDGEEETPIGICKK